MVGQQSAGYGMTLYFIIIIAAITKDIAATIATKGKTMRDHVHDHLEIDDGWRLID